MSRCLLAAVLLSVWQLSTHAQQVTPEQKRLIDEALDKVSARVEPQRPRVILVSNLQIRDGKPWQGPSFRHLPAQNYAIEQLGQRTGAYRVVFSNDVEMFRPGTIEQFDAIFFNNTNGVLFDDPELKASLLGFVAGGKGFIGVHEALATFVQYPVYDQWPEFGQMIGGTENGGHPWNMDPMTIRIDDPNHPLNEAFEGQPFTIVEQAFQLQEPTFRDRLRVLLSIDPVPNPASRRIFPARQQDMDFPVAWIKRHGEGRVYYTFLGHTADVFQDARFLQHLLAGVQYALGDLKADDTPSARP